MNPIFNASSAGITPVTQPQDRGCPRGTSGNEWRARLTSICSDTTAFLGQALSDAPNPSYYLFKKTAVMLWGGLALVARAGGAPLSQPGLSANSSAPGNPVSYPAPSRLIPKTFTGYPNTPDQAAASRPQLLEHVNTQDSNATWLKQIEDEIAQNAQEANSLLDIDESIFESEDEEERVEMDVEQPVSENSYKPRFERVEEDSSPEQEDSNLQMFGFSGKRVKRQRSSPCHRKCKYVEAFQQANCEDRGLTQIPIECNAASYLSLKNNNINYIEPGVFKGFPFLKYLILSNNNISRVDDNTFVGAPQLKSIKLLYNSLGYFSPHALNGTENRLRNIYLSRNNLTEIAPRTFQYVPRLEVIDLYRNKITVLQDDIFEELRSLERLFLGMNKLTQLDVGLFSDLSSLLYLDLSNNTLTTLPYGLFNNLHDLETVDLSGNRLISNGDILSLPNIKLDLRWNNLSHLESLSRDNLKNVRTLFLEGNPWVCDEGIRVMTEWYQDLEVSNDEGVIIDSPLCHLPLDLKNQAIASLNLTGEVIDESEDGPRHTTVLSVVDSDESEDGPRHTIVLSVVVPIAGIAAMLGLVAICVRKKRAHEEDNEEDIDMSQNIPQESRLS